MQSPQTTEEEGRRRFPWWLALIIVLGLGLTLVFGLRVLNSFHRMPRGGQREPVITDVSLIRDWMTIPYIARAYAVPGPLLFDRLQLDPKENDRRSLAEIAAERNPDHPEQLIADISAIILDWQAQFPEGLPTPTMLPGIPPPPRLRP
jgi:hypothetical protein